MTLPLVAILVMATGCGEDDEPTPPPNAEYEETTPRAEVEPDSVLAEMVEFPDGTTLRCAYVFNTGLWCG